MNDRQTLPVPEVSFRKRDLSTVPLGKRDLLEELACFAGPN